MATPKKRYVKIDCVATGRLGGKARAANLSESQRRAAARKANKARWDAYYQQHPEKIRPAKKRKRKAA